MNAARLWPAAIAGVLVVTVAANAVLLYQASDREAAAVEPDYYRRAVAWDSTLAQERRNAALGWRLAADLGAPGPAGTPLLVRLADARGHPLAGLSVTVEAIHNRESTRRVRATLRPAGERAERTWGARGRQGAEGTRGAAEVQGAVATRRAVDAQGAAGAYAAALPLGRTGLWELRLVATRGTERFTASLRREVEDGP